MMKNKKYNEKGAAAVELGVMLIVLVPLIFYFFFITDLCYQIVNTQETVISTVWDYATAPFGVYKAKMWGKTNNNYGGVDNFNRFEFADHTSAKLDYQERSHIKKHTRFWAELDWGNGSDHQVHTYSDSSYYNTKSDPHQVACQRKDEYAYAAMTLATPVFSGDGNNDSHSGRYLCWARGEVVNYLIPKYFSPTGHVEEKEENQLISARGEGFGTKKNVYNDRRNNNGWLAFRNRASLVAGDWSAIADHVGSHKNIEVGIQHDLVPQSITEDSYFFKKSWEIFRVFQAVADVKILGYTSKLASQKLAAVTAPRPSYFYMAATFSHSGNNFKINDYKYKPTSDFFGDELFTVSNRQYLQQGSQKRGQYYLGAKQSLQ